MRLVLLFAFLATFASAESIAITHVTVIDATGRAAQPEMTVIVAGERIAAIGPSKEAKVPRGAHAVDGRSKFLIPGLWDMHVHGATDGRATQSYPLYLANGVLGVREMFGPPDAGAWRVQHAASDKPSPAIFLAEQASLRSRETVGMIIDSRKWINMSTTHPSWSVRLARAADMPALHALIEASVRGLQAMDYTPAQIEGALGTVLGLDTQLIRDQTYFVAEPIPVVESAARKLVACGGWSKRKTLFGADRGPGREPGLLDPAKDAAKVRAIFVHPDFARLWLGRPYGILRENTVTVLMDPPHQFFEQRLDIVNQFGGLLLVPGLPDRAERHHSSTSGS
jgi:hypothetical protein